MTGRTFPIQPFGRVAGAPAAVPWALVAGCDLRARRNLGQSLEVLAERGGLSWAEVAALLEDRRTNATERNEAAFRSVSAIADRRSIALAAEEDEG